MLVFLCIDLIAFVLYIAYIHSRDKMKRTLTVLVLMNVCYVCVKHTHALTGPVSNANQNIRFSDKGGAANTIFVSIASFRDAQCHQTIRDLYEKALDPMAIFVGAVEQHERGTDPPCIPPEHNTDECHLRTFCPSDNIQVRYIPPPQARGPTFGRYLGALMYTGQTYYMMIDSHNRFVTHWDAIVIRMYRGLQKDGVSKPVLSHYPEGWHNPDVNPEAAKRDPPLDNRPTTSYTCSAKFVDVYGFVRFDGATVPRPADGKPRPQPWAAAGFLFANASVITEVPFDPHLNYVFLGEEILYSARLWTHGYDIFSPSENVMYHYYTRPGAPRYNQFVKHAQLVSAEKRIQRFLQAVRKGTNTRLVEDDDPDETVQKDAVKYGLGRERTLDAYYAYAGINKSQYTVQPKFCPYKARG